MNHFWFKNENDPCSLSEASLFFYLLYEANRQHWVMPFKVSTQMLVARLNTSKQNIMKAREGLRKRGLIGFSKGEGKGKPAMYQLCVGKMESGLFCKDEESQPLTQELPHSLTQALPEPLTQTLSLSNIKEKEIYKEDDNKPLPPVENNVLTLSMLQERMLNDEIWLAGLSRRLVAAGVTLNSDDIRERIRAFFREQQEKGITEKDEGDCRNYVFNWIKYHLKNKKYGQESRNENKVGRAEISLIAQKTITVPVRFPMTTEKAALYLETAVQAEVMARGNSYKISHEQKGHILQMAALLTRPSTQFGILLCGGVGNGKTTMMKAFQNLLNYLRIPIAGTSETYGMRIESAKFLCSQVKMDSMEFLHIQQMDMLGIDDLGEEEPEVVSYGNRVTPVIDLLSYRL